MSTLIIVESPGKIKKISEYLGDNYIVMASVGHIIDLDEKKLSIDEQTFEPQYKRYDNKIDVIKKLEKQTTNVGRSNVLLASDEDREGEMIAWSLAKELSITNPKRIVFNSITKKELENAVKKPQKIDMNMVNAQQARRILDRLAGYIISPILYKSLKGAQSAGRVQSVVVKIVVDREKEIDKFFSSKSDTYFTITTDISLSKSVLNIDSQEKKSKSVSKKKEDLSSSNSTSSDSSSSNSGSEYELTTKLYEKKTNISDMNMNINNLDDDEDDSTESQDNIKKKSKTKPKIKSTSVPTKACVVFTKDQEEKVVEIIKNMVKSQYKLLKMSEKIRKANPPPPFTTSTLQQLASQKLSMDAKRTMSVAQKLYESGYITYMRTDSTAICDEEIKKISEEITNRYGSDYFEFREYKNKKANTQEAHECVRPTKINMDSVDGTSDEKRLYTLIWKRTIQSQMKASEYQNLTIEIEMLGKKILNDYKLVGNLENLIFLGYLIVDNKKQVESMDIKLLSKLLIDWISISGIEDTQKPPSRYNEASLINKLDPKNLNIGRPSTYASIIDKIIGRKYVEISDVEGKNIDLNRYFIEKKNPKSLTLEQKKISIGKEKRRLVPTVLGKNVTDFLEKYFEKLMDYGFTANMEKQLDDVAEGKINKLSIIKPFYEYIKSQINLIDPKDFNKNVNNPEGKKYSQPIKLGLFGKQEIILNDGPYGKYISCGLHKINLKTLFGSVKRKNNDNLDDLEKELEELELQEKLAKTTNNNSKKKDNSNDSDNISYNSNMSNSSFKAKSNDLDDQIDLDNLSNEAILNKAIEKLETIEKEKTKEWKIGKKKYILKNGQYGYFVEEWNTTSKKKIKNMNIKFLINNIGKKNNINVNDDVNKIIELITDKDIEETAKYYSKKNK
jgi:DNA topoisomerase-1